MTIVVLGALAASAAAQVPAPDWSVEGNKNFARLGNSVATAGDVDGDGYSDVIVGAYRFNTTNSDQGAAFLFPGAPAGPASTFAWSAIGSAGSTYFGNSVATAGDVNGDGYSDVIVGAYAQDTAFTDTGAAFVFLGSAAGLAAAAASTINGTAFNEQFGMSVSGAGDVNNDGYSDVVIGAPQYHNGQTDEGGAFLYLGSASGLAATASWTAESGQAGALLGACVALAGDVDADGYSDVIVGAPVYANGQGGEGRAYVYRGTSSGLGATAQWTAESNNINADFGRAVATAGDVNGDGYSDVVVGAPNFTNGQFHEGTASLFLGSAGGIATSSSWSLEGEQANANYGASVACAGDVDGDGLADVAIGAPGMTSGQANEGLVYRYRGTPTGIESTASWTAEIDQAAAKFGDTVATAGDVDGDGFADVVAGAPDWTNPESKEGTALVYVGTSGPPDSSPAWTAVGNDLGSQLGRAVGPAGDADGDGYADVLIGVPGFSNAQYHEGAVERFEGSAAGLAAAPAWSGEGGQYGAALGSSVVAADVNGDGYPDVVAGAPYFANGQIDEGRLLLFFGSSNGTATLPGWTYEGGQVGARLGQEIASAGDVNGDGYPDVIAGAQSLDAGQVDEGRAFVFAGAATGFAAAPLWTAEGNQTSAQFGVAVGGGGDVNGDGFSDVVVGADRYDNGQTDEGRAFVFFGSIDGPLAAASWTAESNQASAHFGASVAGAGDVNGDGFSDVLVGAPDFDNGQSDEGRASVFLGSSSGPGAAAAWTAESDNAGGRLGKSVCCAGDVNGDGLSDVAVAANDTSPPSGPVALLYVGTATGIAAAAAWVGDGSVLSYGDALDTAGDVNADGYADVAVGEWTFAIGAFEHGRALVYLGNGAGDFPSRLRQRRADDSVQIAQFARTVTNSFRARMLLRSPFGRGDVQLALEAKPVGTPFDGTTSKTAKFDTGANGVELSLTKKSLVANTAYRWRARVEHSPASTPLAPHGRWISPGTNAPGESDLHTDVCGGAFASAVSYGTGKPGTNGLATLSSSALPAKGAITNLTIAHGLPGASPVLLFMNFAPASLAFDGGTLWVNPLVIVTLPPLDWNGSFVLPLALSTNPATCGLDLYFQALFVDPGASGFYHTVLTNGLHWELGS